MPFHITALYAGLNGLILLVLAVRVALMRGKAKVGVGTGGNADLERKTRVHGNAVENIPIILILMGLAEANGASIYWIHGLGVALTLGRLFHAWGLTKSPGESVGRAVGMSLTWLALAAGSIRAILAGLGVI